MFNLNFVSHTVSETDLDRSQITDLEIMENNGDAVLISTTRYDGVLQSWQIGTATPTVIDTVTFDGGDLPGGTASLAALNMTTDSGLLTGGGTGGLLQVLGLNSDGTFAASNTLGTLPTDMTGFQHGTTVTLADGTQVIYGGLAGHAGIAHIAFNDAGDILGHGTTQTPTSGFATQVATTATAVVAGQDYLFTANPGQNAVTSWAIAEDGQITASDHIDPDDGLWISAPTVMQTAQVGGVTYVVLGSAGSSTISVMEVGTDGSLTMRDHLLDSLGSRFYGITTLEVATHNGQTYIIAGGADDGISVFTLLEGGFLVSRAHIEDTNDMGLDNISAIAVQGRGEGLDIFVASSSEAGLTQLRFDTGTAGATITAVLAGGLLQGGAGNDILQGHNGDDQITAGAGDDILRDGAGNDTLTGGTGADVFILSRDGETDIIRDFTLGEDKLDLSMWPLLRDISQLTFTIQSYGMDVAYGDELLIVYSADGSFIDYRQLTNADLIGDGTRFSTTIEPGYPGPLTPTPNTDQAPAEETTSDAGIANSMMDGIAVISEANLGTLRDVVAGTAARVPAASSAAGDDVVTGTAGNDVIDGGTGMDIIMAGAGDDMITGGNGADILLGRGGDDTINGGADGDLLMGGSGNDQLFGEAGNDILYGGADNDTLAGGAGDDILLGDAGADTFVFNGGTDTIADFEQDLDQITIDVALWTGLTAAQDVLTVYGSFEDGRVTIDFEEGNILHIDGVTDYATFAQDIALF